MDIEKAITDGIVFKGGKSSGRKNEEKVKTKAKKKSYMKADIRKKRANRHKGK